VLKGRGSLEAVWNESCARHMTRNGLYLYGALSIRRSLVQSIHSVLEPVNIIHQWFLIKDIAPHASFRCNLFILFSGVSL
jgi:hypothetical protein